MRRGLCSAAGWVGLLGLVGGCGPAKTGQDADRRDFASMPLEEVRRVIEAEFPASAFVTNDYLPPEGASLAEMGFSALEEPIPLRVAMPWVLNDEEAAWYVALEKGYFAEAGLEVELLPGGPGIDPLNLLVGGRADIGVPAASVMLTRLLTSRTTADLVAVGTKMKRTAYVWLMLDERVPRDQRSERQIGPEDLEGATVGVQPGYEFIGRFLTQRWELPQDHFRLRTAGFTPDPLVAGAVDFYAAWITNQPRVLEAQGIRNWVALDFGPLGLDENMDVSVVHRELLRERPEVVRRYLWALGQAMRFILDEPRAAAEITVTYARDAQLTVEQVMRRFELERPLVLDEEAHPLMYMDPAKWNTTAAVLLKYGQIELPSAR